VIESDSDDQKGRQFFFRKNRDTHTQLPPRVTPTLVTPLLGYEEKSVVLLSGYTYRLTTMGDTTPLYSPGYAPTATNHSRHGSLDQMCSKSLTRLCLAVSNTVSK